MFKSPLSSSVPKWLDVKSLMTHKKAGRIGNRLSTVLYDLFLQPLFSSLPQDSIITI